MAETDTPVVDPKPDTGQPGPPPGPSEGSGQGGGFGGLAGAVYQATDEWKRSAAQVREGLAKKAEAMEAPIAAAEKELQAPRPTPPAPPGLPQPPSRQLTEFLAPVDGESPVTSVTKLLNAIGLFATGASGAVKGDARAGLAAFTGAMKGWQEGDRERADRHFADWEAKTLTALTKWRTERQTYQDIMAAANLSLDQRFKLIELAAIREENKALASVAEKKDLETLIGFLGQREQSATQLEMARQKMLDHRSEFDRQQTEIERYHRADIAAKLEIVELKAKEKKETEQAIIDSYSDEDIKKLGQLWAMNKGEMPSGLGRSGAGNIIRGKITKAGIEWWESQGRNVSELPAARAEMAATKNTLATLEKNRGVSRTNGAVMEKHLDTLVEMGSRVDRSGAPVVNRYALYVRGEYAGDAEVAAYQAQAYEVGQELAKFFVGTAQGDANSREEARKIVRGELNQEQLKAVAGALHVNAKNRMKAQDDEIQEQINRLKALGEGSEKRPMPDAPPLSNDPLGIRK